MGEQNTVYALDEEAMGLQVQSDMGLCESLVG